MIRLPRRAYATPPDPCAVCGEPTNPQYTVDSFYLIATAMRLRSDGSLEIAHRSCVPMSRRDQMRFWTTDDDALEREMEASYQQMLTLPAPTIG